MRKIKKGLLAGVVLCCMPVLSACSFKETLKVLWNSEDKTTQEGDSSSETAMTNLKVDESVEKPTILNEFGDPVTYGKNGIAEPLIVDANVSDGGVLSYQWYRNNVDSNGGGTEIEGAVDNIFTPTTAEPGTTYYYVVVTNTVGNGIQFAASTTKCVTITEEEAQVLSAEEPIAPVPAEDPAAQVPVEDPATQAPAEDPAAQALAEDPAAQVPVEDPAAQAPVEDPAAQAPVG